MVYEKYLKEKLEEYNKNNEFNNFTVKFDYNDKKRIQYITFKNLNSDDGSTRFKLKFENIIAQYDINDASDIDFIFYTPNKNENINFYIIKHIYELYKLLIESCNLYVEQ